MGVGVIWHSVNNDDLAVQNYHSAVGLANQVAPAVPAWLYTAFQPLYTDLSSNNAAQAHVDADKVYKLCLAAGAHPVTSPY